MYYFSRGLADTANNSLNSDFIVRTLLDSHLPTPGGPPLKGHGIAMNQSLPAHYFKLAGDQGDAESQFLDGVILLEGDRIARDKSPSAHCFKLGADQRNRGSRWLLETLLLKAEGTPASKSFPAMLNHNIGMAPCF
jgi:TPR repeat protein